LPYLIGDNVTFLAAPGGLLVQLFCEHELLVHSKRAALIAADKFAFFSLVRILSDLVKLRLKKQTASVMSWPSGF